MELWGFAQVIARGIIAVSTVPLNPIWRHVRREELQALVDPCGGERRITALTRLLLVAVRFATHDIVAGRVRRPRLRRPLLLWGHQSGADITPAQTHLLDALRRNDVTFSVDGHALYQFSCGIDATAHDVDYVDEALYISVAFDDDNPARLDRALAEVGLAKSDVVALGVRLLYGPLNHLLWPDGVAHSGTIASDSS
jgi:hypothetical protein